MKSRPYVGVFVFFDAFDAGRAKKKIKKPAIHPLNLRNHIKISSSISKSLIFPGPPGGEGLYHSDNNEFVRKISKKENGKRVDVIFGRKCIQSTMLSGDSPLGRQCIQLTELSVDN